MLQVSVLRENKEEVVKKLAVKNFKGADLVSEIISLDDNRRKFQLELDNLNNESNVIAKQIGDLFKAGKKAEADDLRNKSVGLKDVIKKTEEQLRLAEKTLNEKLVVLPNLPHHSVPEGKSPAENLNVHQEGDMPVLPKGALPHWELTSKYNIIDFELGVKLTGAGFPVYKGKGAKLQRALINYFLDKASAAGYMEIEPPILINKDSGYGTGQLPDKDGQMYYVQQDELYLIPTAEVPITNIYRDVILKEEQLPVKNCGYTPCFRREAGSYGKDVRGLNRLHQFDKVEIVQIVQPAQSYEVLEEMREYVASLVRSLELPFRILRLCGGDMSFASAMTYDFEVFSAAQEKWLEVSSVSNFEGFQSNRMKLRYREQNGKPQLAHTLNGSAMALPRIVAALLENNQSEMGIKIPKVLIPYTGFEYLN